MTRGFASTPRNAATSALIQSRKKRRGVFRTISAACGISWAQAIVEACRRVGRAATGRGEAHNAGRGDRWASRCRASFDPTTDCGYAALGDWFGEGKMRSDVGPGPSSLLRAVALSEAPSAQMPSKPGPMIGAGHLRSGTPAAA